MHKILFVTLMLCSACSVLKKPADSTTDSGKDSLAAASDTAMSQSGKDNGGDEKEPYRLVVSFYSKGSGPDSKAIETFLNLITNYETFSKKKIDYDKTPWGREGECDYCMQLINLDNQAQKDFIIQVREMLLNSQLVHITENAPCLRKR